MAGVVRAAFADSAVAAQENATEASKTTEPGVIVSISTEEVETFAAAAKDDWTLALKFWKVVGEETTALISRLSIV